MKLNRLLYIAILGCFCICSNAQDLNWNTVAYTTGSLNTNFGSIGNPAVSVSLNITGYTAGLGSGFPIKRRAQPDPGTGTICPQNCALRSAPNFSNPATQSLVLTFTFAQAVSPLTFPIYDIDGDPSQRDSIRITASGPTGAQTITATNVAATSTIYNNGSTAVTIKGENGLNNEAQTNISITGVVSTLVLTFMGQGTFSVGNMSWTDLLPVKWISFSGNKTNNGLVDLKWVTENEEQCDRYVIERSKDGLQFQEIGRIVPKGEGRNNYYFTDINAGPGNSYYRIAQFDVDGRTEYSKVIVIKQNIKSEQALTISPNPSSEYILLQSAANGLLKKIEIYNTVGKRMYQSQQGNYRININFLSSGMYYLKAESIDGQIFSARFFKK